MPHDTPVCGLSGPAVSSLQVSCCVNVCQNILSFEGICNARFRRCQDAFTSTLKR